MPWCWQGSAGFWNRVTGLESFSEGAAGKDNIRTSNIIFSGGPLGLRLAGKGGEVDSCRSRGTRAGILARQGAGKNNIVLEIIVFSGGLAL
jgi:hypothetical protein